MSTRSSTASSASHGASAAATTVAARPHPSDNAGAAADARAAPPGSIAPELVWLFTGQGAQHPGMGRALHESEPVYREVIDRCAAAAMDFGAREARWLMCAHDLEKGAGIEPLARGLALA